MRRSAWLAFAALVLASPASAAGESVRDLGDPAARDSVRSAGVPVMGKSARGVLLHRFVGQPADSAARGVLMEAFRAEMDLDAWPCESRAADTWSTAEPRTNFFRLVDAAAPEEAWSVDLSIRIPPEVRVTRRATPGSSLPPPRARISHVRSSRGLTIAVTVRAPRTSLGVAASEPAVFSVYFADARRVVVPSAKLPGGGYQYPWADAGRVIARAVLETLHRASGGLTADERAALAPATRVDPAGAEVVP